MTIFLQRLLFVLATIFLTAKGFTQTVIISKCDRNGWHLQKSLGDNDALFSPDPNPGLGVRGSGKLKVGKGGNGNARFTSGTYFKGTVVSALTQLQYSTFVQTNGTNGKAPYLLLEVSYDGDDAPEDSWIFEPAYQSTPVLLNQWQTWDALAGKWYSLNGEAGSGPGNKTTTLGALIQARPAARVLNSHTFKFLAGVYDTDKKAKKTDWDNFSGNIDNIVIGLGGQTTTFDLACGVGPTVNCPGTITENTQGFCGANLSVTTPTAVDGCGNAIATVTGTRNDGKALTDAYPKGKTTITWSATDEGGITGTCTQDVIVTDNQAPVITLPTLASNDRSTDQGYCSYKVQSTEFDGTASDNCDYTLTYTLSGATEATGGSSLANVVLNKGTTTITWTASDGSTDPVSSSFNITVKDLEAPVLTCPALTSTEISTDQGVCSYTVKGTGWDATATDNCGAVTVDYALTGDTQGSGSSLDNITLNKGTTTITWTAIDDAGNIATCSQTIKVVDRENPVVTCPTLVSSSRNTDPNVCQYTVKGNELDATAKDNCGARLTYSLSGVTEGAGSSLAGVVLNKGTTTITWTATDDAGNSNTCSQSITVEDHQAPVISPISASPNVLWSPNHKMVDVVLGYTVTDNCSIATPPAVEIESISSNEPLNGLGDGNTNVDWEVVDAHHIRLNAERSGLLDGRIYTITVKATDADGNSSQGTVTVSVPHDQSTSGQANTIDVTAAPNPSTGAFNLKVSSTNISGKITMVVSNSNGTVVYTNNNVHAGEVVSFGDSFTKGTYYVKFSQGDTVTQVTLVKL